jgi:hypothetical protein
VCFRGVTPETEHLKKLCFAGIPQWHYVVELSVVALADAVAGRTPAPLTRHDFLLELG